MKQTLRIGESQLASQKLASQATNGVAGWLFDRMRRRSRPQARLAVLERIALAPRHSLALIEAEGRKLLVATSQDGPPVFYALDATGRTGNASRPSVSAWRPLC